MDYDVKFTFDVPKNRTFVVSQGLRHFRRFLGVLKMFEDFRKFLLVSDFRFYDDRQDFSFEVFVSRTLCDFRDQKVKALHLRLPGNFGLPLNDKENSP